jgi:hypothetical protein
MQPPVLDNDHLLQVPGKDRKDNCKKAGGQLKVRRIDVGNFFGGQNTDWKLCRMHK